MIVEEENYLMHYGILRKSGRYPWGSGRTQDARNKSFLGYVDGLRKEGMSETEIARGVGITTTELRAAKSIARNAQKQADIDFAQRLKEKGLSNIAIGAKMNLNESSVRALLAPGTKDRNDVLQTTASMLKDQVEKKTYLDVGTGVENHLGITSTKLSTAIAVLKEEGYKVHYLKIPQVGVPGQFTSQKVLTKPDVPYSEVYANQSKVQQITDYSQDGGRSYLGIQPPLSLKSSRLKITYAEDGGSAADGVLYVRPGVKDISLGAARYAQVRVKVDDTHYIKGMAMYKDDLPDGVDILFNTNKSNTGNKLDALKELKDDEENPFGSTIPLKGQITERDSKGNVKVTSVMNKVNEEGDWDEWSRNLSRQVLSKQSPALAKTQLNMTYERKQNELDTILKLTNPTVRKKLLDSFADDADSSSIHLKAAALPRQRSQVILPINSIKPTEIYAPNFRNGERVALIRFPHAGTFEIPELVVNNNHPEAKAVLGDAKDAVAIHHTVAQRLSGADFDGDTVLVIPNNNRAVKTTPALLGLKNFDPQHAYPEYEGMPPITSTGKQHKMGDVTNLISDMTIRGANTEELARAVRHSMVVIDAEKHNLNYRQSYIDNGIAQLKERYQGSSRSGSSTLITRAKTDIRVPERKPRSAAEGGPIDKATGKKVFTETGDSYINKDGKLVLKTTTTKKLAEAEDAHTLSSGTPIEAVYADHSNRLKDLANKARKESVHTDTIPYSPSAKTAYAGEVTSLNHKLNVALRNRPLERQAQLLANAEVSAKRAANPNMDAAELKKIKGQALTKARLRTGAGKEKIDITDQEWSAIQAGAVSNNKLTQILNNTDIERVKQLATPQTRTTLSDLMHTRAVAMVGSGYTQAEIADQLGVSLTTLKTSLSDKP